MLFEACLTVEIGVGSVDFFGFLQQSLSPAMTYEALVDVDGMRVLYAFVCFVCFSGFFVANKCNFNISALVAFKWQIGNLGYHPLWW